MFKNKKYVIGVSGGPDSMALLDMYKDQVKVVCHVNYHFRKDSNLDQELVKQYCLAHNLELRIKEIDPSVYQQSFNFENFARKERYSFFRQVANEYDLNDLLLAHHLDDHIETCLMQYNKKSLTTFYGIRQNNIVNCLKVFRPLLNKRKKELIDYCNQNNIKYVIDSTNNDLRFERNKIRFQLSKLTDQEFKQLVNKFKQLNQDLNDLDQATNAKYAVWTNKQFNTCYLLNQEPQLQIHLVYRFLINFIPLRITKNKINSIIKFIASNKSNTFFRLNNGYYLHKKNKYLTILKK